MGWYAKTGFAVIRKNGIANRLQTNESKPMMMKRVGAVAIEADGAFDRR